MDKFSYAFGIVIGKLLVLMCPKDLLNMTDFSKAITDIYENNTLSIAETDAQNIVNEMLNSAKELVTDQIKESGEKFLKANAKKDGINITVSGLLYEVIQKGNGKKPTANDTVRCI